MSHGNAVFEVTLKIREERFCLHRVCLEVKEVNFLCLFSRNYCVVNDSRRQLHCRCEMSAVMVCRLGRGCQKSPLMSRCAWRSAQVVRTGAGCYNSELSLHRVSGIG